MRRKSRPRLIIVPDVLDGEVISVGAKLGSKCRSEAYRMALRFFVSCHTSSEYLESVVAQQQLKDERKSAAQDLIAEMEAAKQQLER